MCQISCIIDINTLLYVYKQIYCKGKSVGVVYSKQAKSFTCLAIQLASYVSKGIDARSTILLHGKAATFISEIGLFYCIIALIAKKTGWMWYIVLNQKKLFSYIIYS